MKTLGRFVHAATIAITIAITAPSVAWAVGQTDTSKLIDEARARAKKIDEVKAALADPDQTVRLAIFEGMVTSDDPLMRDIALQGGLASSDALMRAQAFKHALLAQERLVFTLTIDDSQPKERIESDNKAFIERGSIARIEFDGKAGDIKNGVVKGAYNNGSGKVEGMLFTFSYGNCSGYSCSGELRLQDDNTLSGRLRWGEHTFKATAAPF